jgi:hypothetical protein
MFNRLICFVRGHQYTVTRRFNPGARQVNCPRCGGLWAMHDGTRAFVPWDGSFEEMYRFMGQWPGTTEDKKMSNDLQSRLREEGAGREMFGFDGMLDEGYPLLIEAADELDRKDAELAQMTKDRDATLTLFEGAEYLRKELSAELSAIRAADATMPVVAWLKEWNSVGNARTGMRRADLTPDCETWLANMFPKIEPLTRHSDALAAVAAERAKVEALESRYNELLLAVGNKHPGETRHQTALRYLRQAEDTSHNAATERQGERE